jgi:archaellum component FlaF (FlaF/FlaG flagellin family)
VVNDKSSTQAQIDAAYNALIAAQSNLAKRNTDLKITKVVRSGNSYRITIRNDGRDDSTATRLRLVTGGGKYEKFAKVSAIGARKSITITVKFFKYSDTRRLNKHFVVNHNKQAFETNYKNNRFVVQRT